MSEERPKLLTITIRPREGETERLNVFNAEEWMDTTAGKPGRFRLRRNGAWVRRGREKYTFFTGQGVQRYLATLLEDKGRKRTINPFLQQHPTNAMMPFRSRRSIHGQAIRKTEKAPFIRLLA